MAMSPTYFYAPSHRGVTFGVKNSNYGPLGHRGQDFKGWGVGTAIPSWVDGTVVVNTQYAALGFTVIIEVAGAGLFAGFCHMQLRSLLKVGQRVRIGDEVGALGATGSAAKGPHLHATLEPTIDIGTANAIDPLPSIINALGKLSQASNGSTPIDNSTPAPIIRRNPVLSISIVQRSGVGKYIMFASASTVSLTPEISVSKEAHDFYVPVALKLAAAVGLPYAAEADIPVLDDSPNGGWYLRNQLAGAAAGMPASFELAPGSPYNAGGDASSVDVGALAAAIVSQTAGTGLTESGIAHAVVGLLGQTITTGSKS